MKVLLSITATCAILAIGAVPVGATAGPPAVSVSPAHGLRGGDTVHVSATGLTASASVEVILCDTYVGDPEQDCPDLTTTTADANGGVSLHVALAALVWRSQPFGDSTPVYCRADNCRIFLAWTDQNGVSQVVSSRALEFAGAPARIHARPASNLGASQVIRVNGSAYGAFGHKVRVLEEACYAIIQGSGCYGALPAVTTRIKANGTFVVHYRARQILADGTNCSDSGILGFCEMTVVVLTHGQPDDSFGVSSIGQPAAPLTFLAAASP